MNANVLQHQYAILGPNHNAHTLATKGICICTGWYGWDSENEVCFLCHFDHPISTNSVPTILKQIKECSPESKRFKSVLVGGKRWFWSKRVRKRIKDYVSAENGIQITIKDGPFDAFCGKRNLVISSTEGRISIPLELHGSSIPSGFSWFCGPMQQVMIDA